MDRAAPEFDRGLEFFECSLGVSERNHCNRHQALVVATEVRHRPVVSPRSTVDEIEIVRAHEVPGEGREDVVRPVGTVAYVLANGSLKQENVLEKDAYVMA